MKDFKIILSSIAAVFIFVCSVAAVSADTLGWDPNLDTVDGYKVHWGTSDANPSNTIDVGNATQYVLDSLPLAENTEYFFRVSAYNSAGESGLSTPVGYTLADQTPPIPPGSFTVELR